MLECYYCKSITKEYFERLFSGLDIGRCPSASRSSYFVLKLDLSFGAEFISLREVQNLLCRSVFDSVDFFNARYNFDQPLPSDVSNIMAGLNQVATNVFKEKGRLLILIDEYDRLANKLMFEDPDAYKQIVLRSGNENPLSSPIRDLFTAIKALGQRVACRSIVTGITPLALADSSGGNIWANVSLQRNFGDCFGFNAEDIGRALSLGGLKGENLEAPFNLMVKYYNGHQFPGSTRTYFNPTLCLYFLFNYFADPDWLRTELEAANAPSNHVLKDLMCDVNFNTGDNVLALLCQSKATSAVVSQLLNKDNPVIVPYIHKTMKLRELIENSTNSVEQENLIASFMFYHGVASIRYDDAPRGPPYKLYAANELVRTRFLSHLRADLDLHEADILACFSNPDAESVRRVLQNIVDRQETIKDNSYGEGALQSEIESALNAVQENVDGLQVRAERNVGDGRYDLCIQVGSAPTIVLELKRVRPNAVDYAPLIAGANVFLPRTVKWNLSELNIARGLLGKALPSDLRQIKIVFPELYSGLTSVAQIENSAEKQCNAYLRQMPRGAVGFTVIQVCWIFLVKAVRPNLDTPL